MQCPNVLSDGPPRSLPETRKRKWDDLQSKIKIIEDLYKVKVGNYLTAAEFDSRVLKTVQPPLMKGISPLCSTRIERINMS